MKPLRIPSLRPALLVDPRGFRVNDPATVSLVGKPAPFGRERVLFALPLNGSGPVQIAPAVVWHDPDGHHIADVMRDLIGSREQVWCHRMLRARWTQDTRRLAG
jgi:hypothetical protein